MTERTGKRTDRPAPNGLESDPRMAGAPLNHADGLPNGLESARTSSAAMRRPDEPTAGPYVILAAFWSPDDVTDEVAAALRAFPTPDGYSRGAVVSFRREVAESPAFRRELALFDLEDLFQAPPLDGSIRSEET